MRPTGFIKNEVEELIAGCVKNRGGFRSFCNQGCGIHREMEISNHLRLGSTFRLHLAGDDINGLPIDGERNRNA